MNDNYTLNDEGELVLDDSARKNSEKWKKIAIIAIAICIALIILIIIIVFISSIKKDESSNSNKQKQNQIGEIICTYDIKSTTEETQILGSDYDIQNKNYDVSIDNEIIKDFTRSIVFNSTGYQKVKFILYDIINMEKMFKEISSLISVEMTTNKNLKIISI